MSALVFWKDEHELDQGLKGAIEVQPFELPQQQFAGARVSDLIEILNDKIQAQSLKEGVRRSVESVSLYGSHVNEDRFLENIIADLAGNTPRLVATMKARAIGVPDAILHVETLTGTSCQIPCRMKETVSCFKLRVQAVKNICPEQQILIYNDIRLENQRALSSYGLRHGDLTHLLLRLSGGFTFSKLFADVSNDSILVSTDFNPNAPKWRVAYKGLNIEGKCKTDTCTAFDNLVIHPKKFEAFNLLFDETAKCPMCHGRVTPITCGFYDCVWKFEGVKKKDGLHVISRWKDAVGEKYHRFDTDQKNGIAEWGSLLIVAKPRSESNAAKLILPANSTDPKNHDACTICWSKIGVVARITASCSHTFHSSCFSNWSMCCRSRNSLPSCPACHKPVEVPSTVF